jgi:hypothetical protein
MGKVWLARCHQYWVMSSPTSKIATIRYQGRKAKASFEPGRIASTSMGATAKITGTVTRTMVSEDSTSMITSRREPRSFCKNRPVTASSTMKPAKMAGTRIFSLIMANASRTQPHGFMA